MYHRNIFGSSSEVFCNLRTSSEIFRNSWKMLGNVCPAFGIILENLQKSSEGGRKSSENHKKRRHQQVYNYNKKNITWRLGDMNFIFEWQNNILRTSAASDFMPPCNILYVVVIFNSIRVEIVLIRN